MSDKTYKKIELTGTSTTSMEDAVSSAVAKASKTIKNMRWFELVETRGRINGNAVTEWQVTLKVGFALDD